MQALINALAWTFVHSLWQGLLAALLAAVIISITGKTKARLRYNSLGIVFILFIATVFITFIVQFKEATPASLFIATAGTGTFNSIANKSAEVITGGFIADLGTWFNNNTRLLLLVWALFFLLNCMKLVAGLATVNRLRHYKTHPVSEEWKIKLQQLQDTLGIRYSIILLQSELIRVPVALGFLKPVILLPVGLLTGIPPEQAEAILLHELGHIRRSDYLVNFLQHFAEAIFFFNPAILWISSLLRQEREACCDDIVVAKTGQKRNYLNALVSFQEYTFTHSPYAVGISSRRQYLLLRVKRIITNENKKLNLLEKMALLSGVLLFSAFTYITQEKERGDVPLTAVVERLNNVQQGNNSPVKNILAEPGIQPTREEKKKIKSYYKPVTDTVPGKKDTAGIISEPSTKKPATQNALSAKSPDKTEADANTVLEEIKEIKEQIGKKKESIGAKKEQLKAEQGKNTREEQALKDHIERERREIEGKRIELERKRALLEDLKRKDQMKKEIKNENNGMKKEIKNQMQKEITNEKGEMKKEIKNQIKNENKNENEDMKKEIKNQNKNEIKNEKKYELNNEIKKRDDKTVLFQNRKTVLFKNRETKLFQTRKSKLFRNISETKPANIAADTRTDKVKLFKLNQIKPEEKEYQLKNEPLKIEPPKPPAAKENAKPPAPPGVKALPGVKASPVPAN